MDDEELRSRVDAFVDEVWEDVVSDIDLLVQVESVEDKAHAAPGMPYGPNPKEALVRSLAIAERLGLEPHDCDGHIGYADLPGATDTQVATIGHTDIVPVGTGWTFDPLRVTRKDGCLVGRGVMDDKGPFVLSLYAAHFLKRLADEAGRPFPYTLRCLVGVNEETSMGDVEWYLEHFDQPAFLFTPDADFPLIFGEKGRVQASITSADLGEGGAVVALSGGTVPNAVPGLAEATVRADAASLPAAEGIDVEPAGEGLARLVAHGRGGHASLPAGTVNAIGLLVDYLLENVACSEAERTFLELERRILGSTDGSTLGIAATDEHFDPLTCIGGTVRMEGRRIVQTIDSRYPTSTSAERIEGALAELVAPFGATVELQGVMPPFLTDPDTPEVRTLVDTYNEVSGGDGEAFTIGGGTYARHFARAVAFGPGIEGYERPAWLGGEHGPDEGVPEAQLKLALKVYAMALVRLMALDLG